jgi:hypothetical protein
VPSTTGSGRGCTHSLSGTGDCRLVRDLDRCAHLFVQRQKEGRGAPLEDRDELPATALCRAQYVIITPARPVDVTD